MSKAKTIIILAGIAVVVLIGVLIFQSGTDDYSRYTNNIKLGEYKGIKYQYQERKVTKKDITDRIKAECEAKATSKETKNGVVALGDTVTLSYKGTVDGRKFTACEKEKGPIEIGSNTLIAGLEDKIVGMHIGDEKEFEVKLPEDYQDKDVRGKTAKIKVKTYSMLKKTVPEYNDEFIKKYTEYKTKAEYESALKKTLKKEKEESATATEKTELMNTVMENSKVKEYPKSMLKKEQETITKQYKAAAETQNIKWDEFLKNYMNMSEKKFEEFVETSAKNQVKWHLVIEAIAKNENLKISDKEYKNKLKELLKSSGFTEKTFKEQYNQTIEEYAKENDMKSAFLEEKVRDFMYKYAKATE